MHHSLLRRDRLPCHPSVGRPRKEDSHTEVEDSRTEVEDCNTQAEDYYNTAEEGCSTEGEDCSTEEAEGSRTYYCRSSSDRMQSVH